MRTLFSIIAIILTNNLTYSQDISEQHIDLYLKEINVRRIHGERCGNEYMLPTKPLVWNNKLYLSALKHAKDMYHRDYFSHYTPEGKNIAHRFDAVKYEWQEIGENLAKGQKSIQQAVDEWVKSPSHCKMLMNPRLKDMAIANYGLYWVHHLGKKIPPGTYKKNGVIYYR